MPIEEIKDGAITSPQGFLAGAAYAGIKKAGEGVLDVALLVSEAPCRAAALFTTNKIKAAPVLVSRKHLNGNLPGAVVVNSGCANACTGKQGLKDAREITGIVADGLSMRPEDVLIASTGVIGVLLPMEKIRETLDTIVLSYDGGHRFAHAIMTTDTFAKEIALSVKSGGASFIIAGACKGAGMIHPDLATMLCFLTTDAAVDQNFLQSALKKAAGDSLNMVSVDNDCSTNDTVFLLSNGMAGTDEIGPKSPLAGVFQEALDHICVYLAKAIARDGEGATKLIEVRVRGAGSVADARRAARCIADSSLVKAAVHGNDPNWGRIVCALGCSGARIRESKIELSMNGTVLMKNGEPQPFDATLESRRMDVPEVDILLDLHLGKGEAAAWGCDLSEEYVTINSDYTT